MSFICHHAIQGGERKKLHCTKQSQQILQSCCRCTPYVLSQECKLLKRQKQLVKNASATENKLHISSLEREQRGFASNTAEAKLPQASYLPLTCELHRQLYALLLQLFQLVALILFVSCVSPTCSHQNMEGAQAEGLSCWSSMKLPPVCNEKSTLSESRYKVKTNTANMHSKGCQLRLYKLHWK